MLKHQFQASPTVGQKAGKLRLDLTNRGQENAIMKKTRRFSVKPPAIRQAGNVKNQISKSQSNLPPRRNSIFAVRQLQISICRCDFCILNFNIRLGKTSISYLFSALLLY
jgi:hypothetical protein